LEGFAPLVASVRRLPAGETGATRKRKFKKKHRLPRGGIEISGKEKEVGMNIAREIFLDMITSGMEEEQAQAVREYFMRIFEMIPEPEDTEAESESDEVEYED